MKTASFSYVSQAMGSSALARKRISRAIDLSPSTAQEVTKLLMQAEQASELVQVNLLNAMKLLEEHDKKGPKVEA